MQMLPLICRRAHSHTLRHIMHFHSWSQFSYLPKRTAMFHVTARFRYWFSDDVTIAESRTRSRPRTAIVALLRLRKYRHADRWGFPQREGLPRLLLMSRQPPTSIATWPPSSPSTIPVSWSCSREPAEQFEVLVQMKQFQGCCGK